MSEIRTPGNLDFERSDLGHLLYTYLFLLLIKVVNDDSYEEVESEERPKDYEEDKVEVHVNIHLPNRLLPHLVTKNIFFTLDII